MRKLVFDRFYIEMNEQDIARIIAGFLDAVSNGKINPILLAEWKFEIVTFIKEEHEIAFSYRLKKLDIKKIELCLQQFHEMTVSFKDKTEHLSTDKYLIVCLPKA
jgi:hypothetical protein